MRPFVLLFGLGLALLGAGASFAQERDPDEPPKALQEFVPAGFYAGVAGLALFDEFDKDIPLARLPIDKVDASFGVSAWVGKRLHRHFAVEGQFDWIEGFDVRLDNGNKGRPHYDLDGWVLSANAKVYFAWGRLQPFAKLGLGAVQMELGSTDNERLADDRKKSDFVTRFGGGLDVYATRSIAIVFVADYIMPVDSLEKLPFLALNLGLQYQF